MNEQGIRFGEETKLYRKVANVLVDSDTGTRWVPEEQLSRETELRRDAESHVKRLQAALDEKPYTDEFRALSERLERVKVTLRKIASGDATTETEAWMRALAILALQNLDTRSEGAE